MLGFTVGTELLMGPVRWVADLARDAQWDWSVETWVIRGMILAFVLCTCWIALLMTRIVLRTTSLHVRWGLPLLLVVAMGGTLFYWLNPAQFQTGNWEALTRPGAQFTIGPFPSGTAFEELRKKGYTGVVSLLHPAVVPFEPALLIDERKSAAAAGIEFIHSPMLPWVSENNGALERIQELVRNGDGRYYVHCYLGKDRVNVVKRHLEVLGASYRVLECSPDSGRRLDTITHMQRGEVTEPMPGVFLGACPTDGEWMTLVLSENVKSVVSLLDPEKPGIAQLLEQEKRLLADHGLAFVSVPVSYRPFDPDAVVEAVDALADLERPVLLHGFKSPSFRTQAVQQVMATGMPGLPPAFFEEPLGGDRCHILAPGWLWGRVPNTSETFPCSMPWGFAGFCFSEVFRLWKRRGTGRWLNMWGWNGRPWRIQSPPRW